MSITGYPTKRIDNENVILIFESKNPKSGRIIVKVIVYAPVEKNCETYYNLGFGDMEGTTILNDENVSDNGDMRKVLRTVVSTLPVFFMEFPDAIVHVIGSSEIRNKYYQKLIRDYGAEISNYYTVQGSLNNKVSNFHPEVPYEYILIKKKKV